MRYETADPHGLLAIFIKSQREYRYPVRNLFVLWLLSLGPDVDAALAARVVVAAYGATLANAATDWHLELLNLLSEAAQWPEARLRQFSDIPSIHLAQDPAPSLAT